VRSVGGGTAQRTYFPQLLLQATVQCDSKIYIERLSLIHSSQLVLASTIVETLLFTPTLVGFAVHLHYAHVNANNGVTTYS
jgi:hypothetical protein